ncbi:MAG: electron transfer flavoprotein subunit beta/FixA family protein [Dehalococcoidia bacterium]|nr:electron transfer flavoprotein subunit beta/FixA family protein [Dehalococcoidia bacterium]
MPVNIIVCMKQVLDPEAPVSAFRIDPEAKRAIPAQGTPPVLNPFDENALEGALRIKAANPGSKITVISMGKQLAKAVVRKSLAVGADDLVLLEDPAFDTFDPYFTASVLAAAVKKVGRYDLIMCGRQAADTDAGQVGSGLAEILGIPSITLAKKVEIANGRVMVERVLPDGYETIEATLPVLITATNELGELRSASVAAIMQAQKKPLVIWKAQDLGIDVSKLQRTSFTRLFQPVREVKCQIVEGATPEEAGRNLATKLKESKLI